MRSTSRSMMSRVVPGQQKIAEKLVILNNRAVGMLTRIYNIKKVRKIFNFWYNSKIFSRISIVQTLNPN